MERVDGGWLFISHAHEDIDQVRKIRNYLEDEGFNPIIFFLKSKTNPWTLNSLIKKEIKARKWFVLVDSPHSRKSKWVQREVAYVNRLKDKIILTVDLNLDIIPQLKRIIRRTRVFLSYSSHDRILAEHISKKLTENDFQVWFDATELKPGVNIANSISSAIVDHRDDGIILVLITEPALRSAFCLQEIAYAIEQGCLIVPVIVGDAKLSPVWEYYLSNVQHLSISENPSESELNELINHLAYFQGVSS